MRTLYKVILLLLLPFAIEAQPPCDILPTENIFLIDDGCENGFPFCIDVSPTELLDGDYSLQDNGFPYSGPTNACYTDKPVYNVTPLIGQPVPFSMVNWPINGAGLGGGIFFTPFDMVDSMNLWDPEGNWFYDDTAQEVKGGKIGHTYGDMVLSDANNQNINLPVGFEQVITGTEIIVSHGTHFFQLIGQNNSCKDSVWITADCPTFNLPATDFLVAQDCDSIEYCFNVPHNDIRFGFVDLFINGVQQTVTIDDHCGPVEDFEHYVFGSQNFHSPPFTFSWSLNGASVQGSFNDIYGLVAQMSNLDPNGDWIVFSTDAVVSMGTSTYGGITITNSLGQNSGATGTGPMGAWRKTKVLLPSGNHEIVVENTTTGESDTTLLTIENQMPLPNLTVFPPIVEACEGTMVTLEAMADMEVDYFWDIPGVDCDTCSLVNFMATINGVFTVTATNCNGEQVTQPIEIIVNPPVFNQVYLEECEGNAIEFDGNVFTQDTTISLFYTTVFGCDSIINLTTHFHPNSYVTNDVYVCVQSEVGTFVDTLINFEGCDSIITTNKIYNNLGDSTFVELTTCNTAEVGTVEEVFTNAAGCDSLVITNTIYEDLEAPTAVCKDVTLYIPTTNYVDLLPQDIDDGSFDNCTLTPNMAVDQSTFTCQELGPNPVTLSITDDFGNQGTCTAMVTILSANPPVVFCKDVTINVPNTVDQFGNYAYTILQPIQVFEGSDGTCDGIGFDLDFDTFSCVEEGVNVVTLTKGSNPYNSATCQANVTVVVDPIIPVVIDDFTCDANAVGQDTVVFTNFVGCDSIVIYNTIYSANPDTTILEVLVCDSSQVGATYETFVDGSGCDSIVQTNTIFGDDVPPVAICQDVTVGLNSNGRYFTSQLPNLVNAGSADDCSSTSNLQIYTFGVPGILECPDLNTTIQGTLEVVDEGNNADTCTFLVTVVDNTAPIISCITPEPLTLDSTGVAILTVEMMMDGEALEICGSQVTYSLSQTVFTCMDVPFATATLTAVDDHGNVRTCTRNFTVNGEGIDPIYNDVSTCLLSEVGTTIDTLYNPNGCDTLVYTNYIYVGSDTTFVEITTCITAEVGTTYETFTNTNGCDSIVEINTIFGDSLPPLANCLDITLPLDPTGVAFLTPSMIDNGSSDDCGNVSLDLSQTTFTCNDAFNPVPVLLYVTDQAGNLSECVSLITVMDVDPPTLSCINVTYTIPANGTVQALESDLATAIDNCPIEPSLSLSKYNFSCQDAGVTEVIVTAFDESGNMSVCTSYVEIIVEDPQPIYVEIGTCDQNAVDVDTVLFTNQFGCDSLVIYNTFYQPEGDTTFVEMTTCDQNQVGADTVTLADQFGCDSLVITNTIFGDSLAPIANCLDIILELDEFGGALLDPSMIDNGSSDDCGGVTFDVSQYTFTCNDIFNPVPVTLFVVDQVGNLSECVSIVTVLDLTPPTVTCIDASYTIPANGYIQLFESDIATAADNCLQPTISLSQYDFFCQDEGVTEVLVTAIDGSGNVSVCTSFVEIIVEEPQPIYVDNGTCDQNEVGVDTVLLANQFGCDSLVVYTTFYQPEGDTTLVETLTCDQNQVGTTYETFTGSNGCDSTVQTNTFFGDTESPLALCQDVVLGLDEFGVALLDPSFIDNGSMDDCGSVTFDVSQYTFTCNDILNPVPVILYVTDQGGNLSECTALVTVEDLTPPTLSCTGASYTIDDNGFIQLIESDIATVTDNCSQPIMSLSKYDFYCQDEGLNEVIVTATDDSGNTATCTASIVIFVVDPQPIVFESTTCDQSKAGIFTDTLSNQFGCDSIVIYDIGYQPQGDTVFVDLTSCDSAQIGTTYEVFTSYEGCDSTVATVTSFGDLASPTALCRPTTVYLDEQGFAQIDPQQVNAGSYDDCGEVSFDLSQATFTCTDLGDISVVLFAVDQVGNMDTCITTVTVVDTILPLITCRDTLTFIDPTAGIAFITPEDVIESVYDNCDYTTVLDRDYFLCGEDGMQQVLVTAYDPSGNSASCLAMVEVISTTQPIFEEEFTCDSSAVGTFTEFITDSLGCPQEIITTVIYNGEPQETIIEVYTCDQTQVGTTVDSLVSVAGCDSLVITNTIFQNNNEPLYEYEYTCDSLLAGVFIDTIMVQNCPQEVITTVTWNGIAETIINEVVTCDSTQVGSITEVVSDFNGCDSIIIVTNTILGTFNDPIYQEEFTCDPNEVGTFTETITDPVGCDQEIITTVILQGNNEPIYEYEYTCDSLLAGVFIDTIYVGVPCPQEVITTVTWNGLAETEVIEVVTCDSTQVGSITEVVSDFNGCDSIIIVTNTILGTFNDPIYQEEFTCDPNEVGTFTETITDPVGCDQEIITTVILQGNNEPIYEYEYTCDSLLAGVFTDTIMLQGCPQEVITTVTWNGIAVTEVIEVVTCDSTLVGTVTEVVPDQNGCDSLILITNTIFGSSNEPIYQEEFTCDSTLVGTFTEIITDPVGCPQEIITIVIYQGEPQVTQIEIVTCITSEVGTFIDTLVAGNGCDSLVITNVIYENIEPIYVEEFTCDSLAAGTFTEVITDPTTGCDQEVITFVNWLPAQETVVEIVTCVTSEVGTFIDTLVAGNGCDSLVITNVVYENVEPIYVEEFTCDSLAVGTFTEVITDPTTGCDQEVITFVNWLPAQETVVEVYTCITSEVGTFTETLTSSNGCDSIIITNVIFQNNNETIFKEEFTCDSTQVGTFTEVITDAAGCDQEIITTVIYENDLPPITQVEYTCDSLAVGTFVETIINQDGCPQEKITEIIYAGPTQETVIEIITCNQQEVGTVTEIYSTQNGCDSLVTTITIYEDTTEPIFIDQYTCDSTEVGTFTEVIINQEGCEQSVITTVSLLDSTDPIIITNTTCDQSQVGSVTETYTSTQGCDSIVIINTIFEYLADTTYIEKLTCDSSLVGTSTEVFTNTAGCDSLVICTTSFEPLPIVHIETTSCNPQDVGDFTEVLQSITGCDSIVIYHVLQETCTGPISLNGIPTDLELPCGAALPLVPGNIYAESPSCPGDVTIEFTQNIVDGDCPGSFMVIREWIATDDCGNQESKTQEIIVTDNEAPIFVNAPNDLILDCGDLIGDPIVSVEDNCDPEVKIDYEEIKDGCDVIRKWTATDACGNQSTHEQVITVTDTIAPMFSAIPEDVTVRVSFGEEIPVDTVFATDNCDDNVEVTMTETEETVSAGFIITRVWTAIDACGNRAVSEAQKITVIGGPIWPGDTDSTNHVTVMDIFNIGYGYGQTGPVRNAPTTNWVAQYAPLWNNYSPITGTNFRHADTNGDGVINSQDLFALFNNYGLSHNFTRDPNIKMIRNQFTINLEAAQVTSDGWATVDIIMENNQQLVEDFYGVSLNFLFDKSKVVEGSMSITYDNSWIGEEGTELLSVEKEFHSDGRFEAAVVRNNQEGVNGLGRIGSLRFKVVENSGGDFRIKVEEPLKVNSAGNGEQGEDSVEEIDMTVTSTNNIDLNHFVKLFPNPASDHVILQIDPSLNMEFLRIFDVNGQLVQEQQLEVNDLRLDVQHMATGVYFLEITSKEGVMKKRLVVTQH